MSTTSNNTVASGRRGNGIPRVIVATTALLTFISFWRAAAIVLNDLASSAYYAGGEAEGYIGKTAPWFILAIMLFSYTVPAVDRHHRHLLRNHRHHLFLVGKHQRHSRIERKSAAYHEARDGDGGHPHRLVHLHSYTSPFASATVALSAQSSSHRGFARLAGTQFVAAHVRHRGHLYRARPLRAGHERRRITGAGLSRNRAP